ncbi:MAG: carboxypeptidase regulatory-like domain-containing protein [Pirellulales bacterium]
MTKRTNRRAFSPWVAAALVALAMAALGGQTAFALISGGEGNTPLRDPGWPKGAAEIVNDPARIAYWEGPPFGGGQFHAECRGNAKALGAVLAKFAKLDIKTKRLVVHDGVGRSFWLNPNSEPAKEATARMDWAVTVWVPASWERLRKLPSDLVPSDLGDAGGPPAQIDVYTGGNVRWADVTIPKDLTVIDERLEAHGFTPADGTVLEGKVVDLATQQPVAARVRLERVEPQSKGGYRYPTQAEATADAAGHWVIKKTPAGWFRVVVAADGYVPRVACYARLDDQPGWHSYPSQLAHPAPLAGQVTDEDGKPLADVQVRLSNVVAGEKESYSTPDDYVAKTGADGRFQFDQTPAGRATIMVYKDGYCRAGLGPSVATPAKDVALRMGKAAQLRVTVEFAGDRPAEYLVEIEPEGGSKIGTWGGSGRIDADGGISFQNVPPGRYVLTGHPNPSSADQRTAPLAVELKGGQTLEVKLGAK